MNPQDSARMLEEAEARYARAARRLTYLRDSELYDYDVEDLYRIALREYQIAWRDVLNARHVTAGRLPEALAA